MVATDQGESPCPKCGGRGTIKCKKCNGEGGRQAQRLAETSFDFRSFARARGWEACSTCQGNGRLRCECQG
jgi:hypothetical protein